MNRSIFAKAMNRFFFSSPQIPLRSASGMHARGLWGTYHPELVGGTTPLAKHSVEHTPWITLISFRGHFSSSEAQCRANWTEPGYGTQAYMDCITSQSEGSHCWELIRPRSDCSCFDFPYRGLVLEWLGKHRKVCGCQYGLRYGRYVREQIFSPFEIQFRQHLVQ